MALRRKGRDTIDEKEMYPCDDGIPMDDAMHFHLAAKLAEPLTAWFDAQNRDAFITANTFIYYELGNPRKNVGPDFFVVPDVAHDAERDCWRAWNEGGRLPTVIVELVSKYSGRKDRVTNFAIYRDVLRVKNYFILDNRRNYRFEGFELIDGEYVPLQPDARGRLWCEALGLFLGVDRPYLRWYDPDGRILSLGEERADAAVQRADAALQRADDEAARRAEAEREVERLREELARLRQGR